ARRESPAHAASRSTRPWWRGRPRRGYAAPAVPSPAGPSSSAHRSSSCSPAWWTRALLGVGLLDAFHAAGTSIGTGGWRDHLAFHYALASFSVPIPVGVGVGLSIAVVRADRRGDGVGRAGGVGDGGGGDLRVRRALGVANQLRDLVAVQVLAL